MERPKPNDTLSDFTRTILKQRLVNSLDEFPNQLVLGTFKTEDLLIRIGHLLRELGRHCDHSTAENIIYGQSPRPTLKQLGDTYWNLGMELHAQRPINRYRQKLHIESVNSVTKAGL